MIGTSRSHYDAVKRLVDVVVAAVVLVLTLPLQGVIAVVVRRRLGSPVLFRQARPGRDEKIFELVKFRTMLPIDPDRGQVSDQDRMTSLGSFLRATSLDELPTLWNVLRGDMSLVGPRPLLVQYLPLYSSRQHRRHEVRPGVTGLAQVSGRNAVAWDERFELDVQYVEKRSLRLDATIVLHTVAQVGRRAGITDGGATMTAFRGSAR